MGLGTKIFISSFNLGFCNTTVSMTQTSRYLNLTDIYMQGKFGAIIICWTLGIGSIISWNSLTSIEDYYYYVFPVSFEDHES